MELREPRNFGKVLSQHPALSCRTWGRVDLSRRLVGPGEPLPACILKWSLSREKGHVLPVGFGQLVNVDLFQENLRNLGGDMCKPCSRCAPWSWESVTMALPWPCCRNPSQTLNVAVQSGADSFLVGHRIETCVC